MASVEARDWRVGLSLCQRLQNMLAGQYGSDVIFQVGDGDAKETIQAHRFPLIAGSAVLEAALTRWSSGVEQPILVTDVEPTAFKAMLRFLYCEDLALTTENVMALLYVAKKYLITQLSEKCVEFLETQIKVDNVSTILDGAMRYNESDLSKKCLTFINKHSSDVIKSGDFVDISNKSLLAIVKSDELLVESEVDVLTACINWADAECARQGKDCSDLCRRSALGDVLIQIRFPTMTNVEFAKASRKSELLTALEKSGVYEHIALQDTACTTCSCDSKFIKKPRSYHPTSISLNRYTTHVAVCRFSLTNVKYGWPASGTSSAVDFVCSKPAAIAGVGIYGSNSVCSHNVTLTLFDRDGQILANADGLSLISDGSDKPRRLDFTQPIHILAGFRYTVTAALTDSASTYYGQFGSVNIVTDSLSVAFHDSSRGTTTAYGHASQGQIPEIYFRV